MFGKWILITLLALISMGGANAKPNANPYISGCGSYLATGLLSCAKGSCDFFVWKESQAELKLRLENPNVKQDERFQRHVQAKINVKKINGGDYSASVEDPLLLPAVPSDGPSDFQLIAARNCHEG